jgi:hypothetical protein
MKSWTVDAAQMASRAARPFHACGVTLAGDCMDHASEDSLALRVLAVFL